MAGVFVLEDVLERCPAELYLVGHPEGGVEIRTTERGERLVFAYSSPGELITWCGEGQPWVKVTTQDLVDRALNDEVTLVALDKMFPDGHRYPIPDVRDEAPLAEALCLPEPNDEVYVLSRPYAPSHQMVTFEMHPDPDGVLCLLAYTSLELLYEHCGPYQPCVSVPVDRLATACQRSGAQGVLYNAVLVPEAQHRAPVVDWNRS